MSSPEQSENVPDAPTNAEEILDALYEQKVQAAAQQHMPAAIKTLASVMKTSKSDSVKRLAANDLINHGHSNQKLDPALLPGRGDINITLIQFKPGSIDRGDMAKTVEAVRADAVQIPADVTDDAEDPTINKENPEDPLNVSLRSFDGS